MLAGLINGVLHLQFEILLINIKLTHPLKKSLIRNLHKVLKTFTV